MSSQTQLKLATFNIRCANVHQSQAIPKTVDNEYPWTFRKEAVLDQIIWERPDIIGLQEVLDNQYSDLKAALPEYDTVGVGRDDGKREGEAVPIFYLKDRFQLVHAEHSWLTEQPSVPGSKSWDMDCTRMVTLAHLKDRGAGSALPENNKREDIVILNMHFDHKGEASRQKAAELVLAKAQDYARSLETRSLIVAMGDLNAREDEAGYQTMTGRRYTSKEASSGTFIDAKHAVALRSTRPKAFSLLKQPYGSAGTFTGFQKKASGETIDFILLADNRVVGPAESGARWQVTRFGVLPNLQENGQYPFRASDHRMVVACLTGNEGS